MSLGHQTNQKGLSRRMCTKPSCTCTSWNRFRLRSDGCTCLYPSLLHLAIDLIPTAIAEVLSWSFEAFLLKVTSGNNEWSSCNTSQDCKLISSLLTSYYYILNISIVYLRPAAPLSIVDAETLEIFLSCWSACIFYFLLLIRDFVVPVDKKKSTKYSTTLDQLLQWWRQTQSTISIPQMKMSSVFEKEM